MRATMRQRPVDHRHGRMQKPAFASIRFVEAIIPMQSVRRLSVWRGEAAIGMRPINAQVAENEAACHRYAHTRGKPN
jgi:hypothetical protein